MINLFVPVYFTVYSKLFALNAGVLVRTLLVYEFEAFTRKTDAFALLLFSRIVNSYFFVSFPHTAFTVTVAVPSFNVTSVSFTSFPSTCAVTPAAVSVIICNCTLFVP